MARHTRRLPRDREERKRAMKHAARMLEQLRQQAREVRELEAAARKAKAKLRRQILRHVEDRDLDISEIAEATGISRQTIHRFVARNRARSGPTYVPGQRVTNPYRGAVTVEEDGQLVIRFDTDEQVELHVGLARIES